jgi:hypothetical protein
VVPQVILHCTEKGTACSVSDSPVELQHVKNNMFLRCHSRHQINETLINQKTLSTETLISNIRETKRPEEHNQAKDLQTPQ